MRFFLRSARAVPEASSRSSVILLLVLSLILAAIYLAYGGVAILAAPARDPAQQMLPTVPPRTPPAVTLTATPAPVPVEESNAADGASALPGIDQPARLVPPVTFRTPVYGGSSSASVDWVAGPGPNHSNLRDSFVAIFPIWCLWPVAGLILVVAGLDLRGRSRRTRQ